MDHTIRKLDETSGLGYNIHDKVLAAMGDATIGNVKGQRPTPRGRRIVNRLQSVHELAVQCVWESNTSQVCSRCHTRSLQVAASATSRHFAKVCSSSNCSAKYWDHDVNAARNMRFLAAEMLLGHERPVIFSQSLPEAEHSARGTPETG